MVALIDAGLDGQAFWKSLRFPMWLGFVRLRGPVDIDQKSARPKPTPRRVPAPRPACVGSHPGLSHRENHMTLRNVARYLAAGVAAGASLFAALSVWAQG